MDDALDIAGIWPIKEYTQTRQATIVEQLYFWTIYEMCMGADRMTGSIRFMRWWYQYVGREVD